MNAQEFAKLAEPIALIVDDELLILMDTADMVAEEGYRRRHVVCGLTVDG